METHIFKHENFIAGDFPIVTDRQTLSGGALVAKHTALGKVTASGEVKLLDSAATDGSQNPYAILIDEADAREGAVHVDVYLTGCFNQGKVVFKTGESADQYKDAFRRLGIFLKKAQGE